VSVEAILPKVIEWERETGRVIVLDQTRLPSEVTFIACDQVAQVWDAIRRLCVRGAPAIGVAAAYGVCLAAGRAERGEGRADCVAAIEHLATSRPTAVNLFWALDRMRAQVESTAVDDDGLLFDRLLNEALRIHEEDRQLCTAIGRCGADLLERTLATTDAISGPTEPVKILTHCNAGALATGGIGTALAPVYEWFARGKSVHVFADETRPLLQGARLTAWELRQVGIPVTVLADSAAGSLLASGRISAVLVGADRIAASGDVANKVGTYPLAILARQHGVPFFVAAPHSTFDLTLRDGAAIPIEHRSGDELSAGFARSPLPAGCEVWNPAFDVTPARWISAIITDTGVIESPDTERVRRWHEAAIASR